MGSSNVTPFPDWLNCSVGKLVVLCTAQCLLKVFNQEIFRSFHKEITKISVDFHTNAVIPYSYMPGLCNYSIMYLKSVVMERKCTLEDFNSEE